MPDPVTINKLRQAFLRGSIREHMWVAVGNFLVDSGESEMTLLEEFLDQSSTKPTEPQRWTFLTQPLEPDALQQFGKRLGPGDEKIYQWWGEYRASGDPAPLKHIIENSEHLVGPQFIGPEYKAAMLELSGTSDGAKWLLEDARTIDNKNLLLSRLTSVACEHSLGTPQGTQWAVHGKHEMIQRLRKSRLRWERIAWQPLGRLAAELEASSGVAIYIGEGLDRSYTFPMYYSNLRPSAMDVISSLSGLDILYMGSNGRVQFFLGDSHVILDTGDRIERLCRERQGSGTRGK